MRACLFLPNDRPRLAALLRKSATSEARRALLEARVPVELAVQAATAGEWDRRDPSAPLEDCWRADFVRAPALDSDMSE